MYSNKENINILTALLVEHGIRHAVVCPGSRNAPIVHNLNECGSIACYPITDERSAGFYALGMVQYLRQPVAVCVTSGTALLNLAPAVAEAYYQHLPLVVISADRPAAWIDQLDGQTLPQPDALGRFVRKAVSLPEPRNDEERWYCNRLVNEVLLASVHHGCGPVHVNVPISEPLFDFTVEALPDERIIEYLHADAITSYRQLCDKFIDAERPMIVIGQMPPDELSEPYIQTLSESVVVIKESLSPYSGSIVHFDEVLTMIGDDETYEPDFILYFGDTLVSKRMRKFLRKANGAETYLITQDGVVHDPLMNLAGVVECDTPTDVLGALADECGKPCYDDADAFEMFSDSRMLFYLRWRQALNECKDIVEEENHESFEAATVKYFEEQLDGVEYDYQVHYANSTAVRLANKYAHHYVWCNRGVNGIEGSLSTAAGMSVASGDMVFCIIGDLSFFYDQNALWNQNLSGNLRIILLNNGGGAIFHQLPGLQASPACDKYVAASHHTRAKGICEQNDIVYLHAGNMEEMHECIAKLLTSESKRPIVVEVKI